MVASSLSYRHPSQFHKEKLERVCFLMSVSSFLCDQLEDRGCVFNFFVLLRRLGQGWAHRRYEYLSCT